MDFKLFPAAVSNVTWSCVLVLLQLMVSAAAEAPSGLFCNVSALGHGQFQYRLSEPVGSECDPGWEDRNRTAITVSRSGTQDFNRTLVQNLTNQTLILNQCKDYLRFTAMCQTGFNKEARCVFNCSSALALNNSTVDPAFSIDLKTVILLPALVVLIVALAGIALYKYLPCTCQKYQAPVAVGHPEVVVVHSYIEERVDLLPIPCQDPPEEPSVGNVAVP